MRPTSRAWFPIIVCGGVLFASMLAAGFAFATEEQAGGPRCSCPDTQSAKPRFAEVTPLDDQDEIAALEAVQIALSRTDDGNHYVWRWHGGRLAGVVQPTTSFRNAQGAICRHLYMLLTTGVAATGMRTRKTEGIACRLPNGRWQLEG